DSFATAVELYQEILATPAWRGVGVVPDEDAAAGTGNAATAVMQASLKAEREIDEVLSKHPEAYANIEKRAVAAMAKAKDGGTPDDLLAVAEMYPNAAVAPKAMLAAADAFEAGHNARQATHVLRQIYRK